jgi:4-hydroxy-tetrahydrodipicolinate reductase
MEFIGVVINGASGRMGQEITKAVICEPGLKVVGAVEKEVTQRYFALAETPELVPFSSDLDSLLKDCNADVVVDFTNAEASVAAARIATKQKVNMVIGTTGLSEENLAEIEQLCQANGVGAVVAPNFSLGAALLIHLRSSLLSFSITPKSLKCIMTRKLMLLQGLLWLQQERCRKCTANRSFIPEVPREVLGDTRGGQMDGIAIHSLRLPGFMAGQEVIFSGAGETLSLRHNAISRECYLPGVILAIREVTKRKGLTYGLDALLKL